MFDDEQYHDDKIFFRDLIELTKDEFLTIYTNYSVEEYKGTLKDYITRLALNDIKDLGKSTEFDTVSYIFQNQRNMKIVYAAIFDDDNEMFYLIDVFNPEASVSKHLEDFSYETDFLEYLNSGYKIINIEDNLHTAIWEDIGTLYDGETIRNYKGIQKYLKYCKENSITYEIVNSDEFEVRDISKFFVNNIEENLFEKPLSIMEFLYDTRNTILYNIYQYSQMSNINRPREGYARVHKREYEKLKIVDKLISDEREKKKKIDFER